MTVRWLAAIGMATLAAAGAPALPARSESAPAAPAAPAAPEAALAAAEDLADALQLGALAAIMHAEGLVHAGEIRAELFPGSAAAAWQAEAERIYAAERMTAAFLAGLAAAIGPETGAAWIGELTAFFRSGLGGGASSPSRSRRAVPCSTTPPRR